MQELGLGMQFLMLTETLFQVVLDRFDIVVGGRLDGLDPLRRVNSKVPDQVFEKGTGCVTKRLDLWYISAGGKCLEPAYLDDNTVTDQSVFAKYVA